MRKITLLLLAIVAFTMYSCKTPENITYFQDMVPAQTSTMQDTKEITIRNNDKLQINVHSRNAELSQLFNLYNTQSAGGGGSQRLYYTVYNDGTIDFPVIGKVKVEGLTRTEVANLIKRRLLAEDLLKDPIVTVEFHDIFVTVLGAVGGPGRKELTQDRTTILDVIAMSGDLSLQAMRENVKVIREVDGTMKTYYIDLTRGKDIINSPVYYVKQNDIIYVEPNDVQKRQTTVNGNTLFTPSFWMSASSFAIGIASLVATLIKK